MTSIKASLTICSSAAHSVEEAADRHYSPEFRQRTNGEWANRADVLIRISALRATTTDVHITVLDELVDRQRYAERHIIELRTTEGQQIRQEVYVFGQLDADGHLEWIEELTRSLPEDEITN